MWQPGEKGEVNRNKKSLNVIFQQYKADAIYKAVFKSLGKFKSNGILQGSRPGLNLYRTMSQVRVQKEPPKKNAAVVCSCIYKAGQKVRCIANQLAGRHLTPPATETSFWVNWQKRRFYLFCQFRSRSRSYRSFETLESGTGKCISTSLPCIKSWWRLGGDCTYRANTITCNPAGNRVALVSHSSTAPLHTVQFTPLFKQFILWILALHFIHLRI